MKLFIDSADLNEIKEAYSWKIIEGVTTNPSLMKKAIEKLNKKGEKISLESYIKKILKVAGKTPVSLEVTTNDYKNMIEEGKNIFNKFRKYGNTYIKIPVDPCLNLSCKKDFDGIKAIYKLSKLKIPINCTLIFSPEQALFAAKAGAKIISPFVGREDDFIREKAHIKFRKNDYFNSLGIIKEGEKISDNGIVSGIDLVKKCSEIIKLNGLKSEILAASIRNPRQLREVSLAGADIATLSLNVLKKSIKHKKTIEGVINFTKDVPLEYIKISKQKK